MVDNSYIFQNSRGYLKCFQHKEMINVWGDGYANYITCYIHVLKYHTVPRNMHNYMSVKNKNTIKYYRQF
jgi:hypothetical protein